MNRPKFLLSLLLAGSLLGTSACRPDRPPAADLAPAGESPAGESPAAGESQAAKSQAAESQASAAARTTDSDGKSASPRQDSLPLGTLRDDPAVLALLQEHGAQWQLDDQGLVREVRIESGPLAEILPRLAALPQLRSLSLAGTEVDDEQFARLPQLPHLEALSLFDTRISDASAARLAGLQSLQRLSLSATQLTDEGLAHLAELQRLQHLDVSWTDVSGATLGKLGGLPDLRWLDLSWTPIEDQQLDQLSKLGQVQQLVVEDTNLSAAALDQLRKALPETKIEVRDAVTAAIRSGPDQSDTPAAAGVGDLYRLAVADFQTARGEFLQRYRRAATEGEREQIAERPPSPRPVAERLWKLAEENVDHPAAIDALAWIVQADDRFVQDLQQAALERLIERYADHPRLGELCLELATTTNPATQDLLARAAQATSQDEIRGRARFALARSLHRLAAEARQMQQMDEITRNRAIHLEGTLQVGRLLDAHPADLRAKALELFQTVAAEHAQVEGLDETLGEVARRYVTSLEQLEIGKQAPEIQGQDIAGQPLSLSSYRGKVVVLTFWGNWCGPCREMYPQERALVERLKDQPFVLLGVNSDADRDLLRQVMAQEKITWPSWWDGGTTQGPIAKAWNIERWPSIFVLDAEGVIRFKDVRGAQLEQAVDSLLEQLERSAPAPPDAPKNAEPNAKPVDEKPVDAKPADAKPADDKPADDKPLDEKPVDEKPVSPATGG